MLDVLLVIGLIAVLATLMLVGLGVVVAVRIGRSAQRRAQQVITDVRLRADVWTAPSGHPQHDAAVLRRQLRESTRVGRTLLADPATNGMHSMWSHAGTALLEESARLDLHLARIDREPDRAVREQLFVGLRPRVQQVLADSAAWRRTAYAMTVEFETPGSRLMSEDRRDRLDGLTNALHELATNRPRSGRQRSS